MNATGTRIGLGFLGAAIGFALSLALALVVEIEAGPALVAVAAIYTWVVRPNLRPFAIGLGIGAFAFVVTVFAAIATWST